jgi:hypothetical protein
LIFLKPLIDFWWNISLSCLSDIFSCQVSLLSPVHLLIAGHEKHFWVTKQSVHSNRRGTASWILTRQQYQSKTTPIIYSSSSNCLSIHVPPFSALCVPATLQTGGKLKVRTEPSVSDWREETAKWERIMPGGKSRYHLPLVQWN